MGENLWNVVCAEKQALALRRDDPYGLDSIGGKIEITTKEDNPLSAEKKHKTHHQIPNPSTLTCQSIKYHSVV